jgi:hypothetical protein
MDLACPNCHERYTLDDSALHAPKPGHVIYSRCPRCSDRHTVATGESERKHLERLAKKAREQAYKQEAAEVLRARREEERLRKAQQAAEREALRRSYEQRRRAEQDEQWKKHREREAAREQATQMHRLAKIRERTPALLVSSDRLGRIIEGAGRIGLLLALGIFALVAVVTFGVGIPPALPPFLGVAVGSLMTMCFGKTIRLLAGILLETHEAGKTLRNQTHLPPAETPNHPPAAAPVDPWDAQPIPPITNTRPTSADSDDAQAAATRATDTPTPVSDDDASTETHEPAASHHGELPRSTPE